MINHHPDHNLLVEFSTGSLDWALNISVATHLSFCNCCKRKVDSLNALGGAILEDSFSELVPEVHSSDNTMEASLNAALDKIRSANSKRENLDAEIRLTTIKSPYPQETLLELPKVVRKLMPVDHKLKWKRVAPSLREAKLLTGQDKYQISFHKISQGGKVAEHDHRGLEVTVVLKGCFSDENGTYSPGDFIVQQPGDTHRPRATQDQDCLCLSVVEAPVKLTGFIGKVINPFLRITPA